MQGKHPTRDEVLAAVEKVCIYDETVYGEWDSVANKRAVTGTKRKVVLATKMDVIQEVANQNGITISHSQTKSRASQLRDHVSFTAVKKHLQDLASDGEIMAVHGEHWSVTSKYGSNKRSTYFLSAEAVGISEKERTEARTNRRLNKAKEAATEALLVKYALEFDALVTSYVRAHPIVEPDDLWPTPQQAMLLAE